MKKDWGSHANLEAACETTGLSEEHDSSALAIVHRIVGPPTTSSLSDVVEELGRDFEAIRSSLNSRHATNGTSLAEFSSRFAAAAEAEKVLSKWRDALSTTRQFYLLELMSERADPKRKRFAK